MSLRKYCMFVCMSVLCVFSVDHLSYKIATSYWDLSPLNSSGLHAKGMRVLVVSDPQLVGDEDENWLFGMITRMDCDWFLYSGYQEALKKARPDVVLFLGDLLDEGSRASDSQFETYVRRFNSVFKTPHHIKQIHIPGDNDIGGEGWERIEHWLVERFYKYFPSKLITTVEFVDFVTIKDFRSSIYNVDIRDKIIANHSAQPVRIFLSHLGAIDYYDYLSHKLNNVDPHLVLSGHDHWASYISCYKCWAGRSSRKVRTPLQQGVLTDDLFDKSLIYQIVTPTSSYRMGVKYPGYGLMDLDSDGNMKYRVLWLPNRYPLLYAYLVYALTVAFFILMRCAFSGRMNIRKGR